MRVIWQLWDLATHSWLFGLRSHFAGGSNRNSPQNYKSTGPPDWKRTASQSHAHEVQYYRPTVSRRIIVRPLNLVCIAVPMTAACVVLALVVFVIYLVKHNEAHAREVMANGTATDTNTCMWSKLYNTKLQPFNHPDLSSHSSRLSAVSLLLQPSSPLRSSNSFNEQLLMKTQLSHKCDVQLERVQ